MPKYEARKLRVREFHPQLQKSIGDLFEVIVGPFTAATGQPDNVIYTWPDDTSSPHIVLGKKAWERLVFPGANHIEFVLRGNDSEGRHQFRLKINVKNAKRGDELLPDWYVYISPSFFMDHFDFEIPQVATTKLVVFNRKISPNASTVCERY